MVKRIPKQRVFNLISKWKKKFNIVNCEIEIIFSTPDKYISKRKKTIKEESAYAEIKHIDTNKFILVLYNYEGLEDTIAHELLHIKFWGELDEYGDDFEHLIIEKILDIIL